MSKYLETGDIVVSKEAFAKTKSISKSIRRIYSFDNNRRYAVVYHLSGQKDENLSAVEFTHLYQKCKSQNQKKLLCKRYFGGFQFESVDLSKCTLLTKQDEKVDLALCTRRSTERRNMQDTDNIRCLDIEKLFSTLQSNKVKPSASTGLIPKSISDIVEDPSALLGSLHVEYIAEGETKIVDLVHKKAKKQRRRK